MYAHSSPAAAATNTRARSSLPAATLRQDMPQRRTFMYGKSSAVEAKVAAAQIIPRNAIFCIDNLSRSCSIDDIKSFLSNLSVEVLSCFEVKSRRRRGEREDDVANCKAFRLDITADQRKRLLNESALPNSVLISDWFFKPPDDRRGDDMRRRVVDQSNIPLVPQTTSTAGGIEARSANSGSVVAEIHISNEDTIIVTDTESLSEGDGDEHGQQGSSSNQ